MKNRISLVLVDDDSSRPDGIAALFRAQTGFRVLATLADAGSAMETVRRRRPDVVLLNLRQEGDDTLTLAGALHGAVPRSRVVLMGLEPAQKDVAGYVRAGVSGFLMAGASSSRVRRTIQSVAAGVQVLPLELTRSLFGQLSRPGLRRRPTRILDIRRLTDREREVANLIIQGSSNQDISTRLGIELDTVKSHVHRVLSKLALTSRLEVAAFSQQRAARFRCPPVHQHVARVAS